MPVDARTAAQYVSDLRTAIQNRASDYDVGVGPVPDVFVIPFAAILEAQNERLRKASLVVSASNEASFDDIEFAADLAALVSNEGMLPLTGGRSSTTVRFRRTTAPVTDAVVPKGFPIGTLADEATGASVVFMASETQTMVAAAAASYWNPDTRRYELPVPVVAIISGTGGNVAADRIRRPLRSINGFEDVTNPSEAAGGRDPETNRELIARYRLAVTGEQLGVPDGLTFDVKTRFPTVRDLLSVYGTDPLLLRAGSDAGAVDAWVLGSESVETSEVFTWPGVGPLIEIAMEPLLEVLSVTDGVTTFVEGTDYDVVYETPGASGYAGSTRAHEGVRWRVGGAVPVAAVTVTYTYNGLIRALQSEAADASRAVFGRDLLYRAGVAVPIAMRASLRVGLGFNVTTVLNAVRDRILALVNDERGLGARPLDDLTQQGGALELFDIEDAVGSITGVDNFTITELRRLADPAGAVVDLPIARNEYATLETTDLTVTV